MMYLGNLLSEYETKVNETLKAKNDLSEIVKEKKEITKRSMKAIDGTKTIKEEEVRKYKRKIGELINSNTKRKF